MNLPLLQIGCIKVMCRKCENGCCRKHKPYLILHSLRWLTSFCVYDFFVHVSSSKPMRKVLSLALMSKRKFVWGAHLSNNINQRKGKLSCCYRQTPSDLVCGSCILIYSVSYLYSHCMLVGWRTRISRNVSFFKCINCWFFHGGIKGIK